MSTRRNLITTIGTVAAVGVSGCMGDGNSTDSNSNSSSGNGGGNQNLTDSEKLLQKYKQAYDHHLKGLEHFKKAFEAYDNGNHAEAQSQFKKAEDDYRLAVNDYGPNAIGDLAGRVFEGDSEEWPAAHSDSLDNMMFGYRKAVLAVRIYKNAGSDYNDLNHDGIEEVRLGYDKGRYAMGDVEKMRQALP